MIINKNGKWNGCTVLPYNEYRVVKLIVEIPKYRNNNHQYNVIIYFEKPLIEHLLGFYKNSKTKLHNIKKAFKESFRVFKNISKYGW